jgi:hypothetical protein
MKKLIACSTCGAQFVPARAAARFCSEPCKRRAGYQPRQHAPVSLSAAAPTATPTDAPVRFGSWVLIKLDAVGKRALCRCKCGLSREVAVTALHSGLSRACEACDVRGRGAPIERDRAFAYDLARDAGVVAAGRHRGRR